jgi:hypothetical protein
MCCDDIESTGNKNELENRLGFGISEEQYVTIKLIASRARRRHYKENTECKSLEAFIDSKQKGSRRFRKIFEHVKYGNVKPDRGRQWVNFVKSTNTEFQLTTNLVKKTLGAWNSSYYNYRKCQFAFKYYNNTLGLNSRVCHYNREVDGGCTFCKLGKMLPAPKETISHIMYDCPFIYDKVKQAIAKIFDMEIDKSAFFSAKIKNDITDLEFECTRTIFDIIRYTIWEYKLQNRLPNALFFENIIDDMEATLSYNYRLWECITNNALFRKLSGHGDYRQ